MGANPSGASNGELKILAYLTLIRCRNIRNEFGWLKELATTPMIPPGPPSHSYFLPNLSIG
jgi:hypothetical protein